MRFVTVSGPPSSGKTAVIIKTLEHLSSAGMKVGVVKFDCLSTDDDELYRKNGIIVRKGLAGALCPDHYFVSNVEECVRWGVAEGLDVLVKDVDSVIHLVGIIRESGKNTFEAVHHQGTINVLMAASRADVRRYLHMSAMGTREGAISRYHQSKWAGEEAVRASGLGWTIFRPSTIFGPGDSFVNMLAGMMRKFPVIPAIGGGANKMQPVFVNDVAKAFRTALESDVFTNRTWELGGPNTLSLMQILGNVAQAIERRPKYISIPIPLAGFAIKMAEMFSVPVPVTSDQLIMLGEDNIRTGGDPVEELGIVWTTFEEGIRGYLKTGNHSELRIEH